MDAEQLKEIADDEVLRKRLAKLVARFCFRDTKLESFHDRLSNDEMRTLMIDVTNHTYFFFSMLFSTQSGGNIVEILKEDDLVAKWDDPEFPEQFKSIKGLQFLASDM